LRTQAGDTFDDTTYGCGRRFMFPDPKHIPSGRLQGSIIAPVTSDRRLELVRPPLSVSLGANGSMLRTSMPEAAVEEDCQADTGKHDVRFAPDFTDRSHVLPEA
jgi:hypothetical protein